MIFDAHTHICPPEIRADRTKYFEGEPNFRLLYENPRSQLVGAAELVAALDRWGARGACAFGFPWNNDETTSLCNDYVLDAARRFPGRVIPFACVHPTRGTVAVREAERCLAQGARGVGEIATYAEGLGPEVRRAIAPLAELCREAGAPLLLHTNEPVGHAYPGKSRMDHAEIFALIAAHPETKWILAHWGGGLFVHHLLRKGVDETLRNVWYDTAAGPFLYKSEAYRRFAELAGIGKLLYGSDFPLLEMDRYRRNMEEAGLSGEEQAAVLGANLAALLGLPVTP